MTPMQELYQEVILDHNKNPRNFGVLNPHTHVAIGDNPLCGDHIEVTMIIDNGIVVDVKFDGSGCAISKASSSIMTETLKGKTVEEAHKIYDMFHTVVTSSTDTEVDFEAMGKLAVFAGVREFPARVKCASLAWRTAVAAIDSKNEPSTISTE